MKKLLIPILLAMLSFNSYGETFVCSSIINGSIESIKYQRQGDSFLQSMEGYDIKFLIPIYDDSEDSLVLISKNIPELGIEAIFIDKNTMEFSHGFIRARRDTPSHGKCDVIY